jgi:Esterase-like activity of phytase/IPTL-CTERM motif
MTTFQKIAISAGVLLSFSCAQAAISLLGVGSIPATSSDLSGLSGNLESGLPKNILGAFGSGIAYTGQGVRFIVVPDRGPNANAYNAAIDDTTSYQARFQEIDLVISGTTITPRVVKTTLLTNQAGTPLTGLSSGFDATNSSASLRFDPEGVRVSGDGQSVFISDEYGPFLYQFDRTSGRRLRVFDIPAKFKIANPTAQSATEISGNTSGRVSNRGMEGLAISPDGTTLVGLMQNPLLQDGGRNGVNVRMVVFSIATGAVRELVYQLDNASLGVNEITAINSTEFLVVERDGRAGAAAQVKKIYRINIASSTDVSAIAALPLTGLPAGTVAATKTLFIDMLSPTFGLSGATFPEKIEGIAFGPILSDGRISLIVTNDNDFLTANPNNFYVFAMNASDIAGFTPQAFSYPIIAATNVPTLSQAALAALGLMVVGLAFRSTRRRT